MSVIYCMSNVSKAVGESVVFIPVTSIPPRYVMLEAVSKLHLVPFLCHYFTIHFFSSV